MLVLLTLNCNTIARVDTDSCCPIDCNACLSPHRKRGYFLPPFLETARGETSSKSSVMRVEHSSPIGLLEHSKAQSQDMSLSAFDSTHKQPEPNRPEDELRNLGCGLCARTYQGLTRRRGACVSSSSCSMIEKEASRLIGRP